MQEEPSRSHQGFYIWKNLFLLIFMIYVLRKQVCVYELNPSYFIPAEVVVFFFLTEMPFWLGLFCFCLIRDCYAY